MNMSPHGVRILKQELFHLDAVEILVASDCSVMRCENQHHVLFYKGEIDSLVDVKEEALFLLYRCLSKCSPVHGASFFPNTHSAMIASSGWRLRVKYCRSRNARCVNKLEQVHFFRFANVVMGHIVSVPQTVQRHKTRQALFSDRSTGPSTTKFAKVFPTYSSVYLAVFSAISCSSDCFRGRGFGTKSLILYFRGVAGCDCEPLAPSARIA